MPSLTDVLAGLLLAGMFYLLFVAACLFDPACSAVYIAGPP